ncbi:DgyrCDS14734 [Dimorphilus gyrociliatus]|uniref:DgyrCDS14734 n=1 Tax=Dimorphilus gyrociliatus TaxID=2664684 RepID=A0A7I8WEL8_9ANNE|nr:DgyrCDS14734 [Dimorphilus gyrociliatus]
MILKYLLYFTLLVCSKSTKIFLNEIGLASAKVEYIAFPGSLDNIQVYIISSTKTVVHSYHPNHASTAGLTVLSIDFTDFPSSDQFLIVMYQEQAPNTETTYANYIKEDIIDAVVLSPIQNDPNKFSDKVPEWDNKVLYFSSTAVSFSKCFKFETYIPNYWFERPETLPGMNNCPSVDPNAGGDPHFSQKVIDSRTKRLRNICYDIVGRSGQSIYILNDNSTNTSVQGILKDDYYMHQIIIQYKGGVIIVDNSFIQINDKKLKWFNLVKYKVRLANIHVKSTEEIHIETFYKQFKLVTIVKKEFKAYSGTFLNVYFEHINIFYENLGGLIGDIGKKTFIFNENIQGNSNNVKVDNIEIESTITRRLSNECHLLPLVQLIHPKTISDYVH